MSYTNTTYPTFRWFIAENFYSLEELKKILADATYAHDQQKQALENSLKDSRK